MEGIVQSYSVLTLGTVLYCRALVMFCLELLETFQSSPTYFLPQFFFQLICLKLFGFLLSCSQVVPNSFKDLPYHLTKPEVLRTSAPVSATLGTNTFFKSLKSF